MGLSEKLAPLVCLSMIGHFVLYMDTPPGACNSATIVETITAYMHRCRCVAPAHRGLIQTHTCHWLPAVSNRHSDNLSTQELELGTIACCFIRDYSVCVMSLSAGVPHPYYYYYIIIIMDAPLILLCCVEHIDDIPRHSYTSSS